jgi:hypothetical protein
MNLHEQLAQAAAERRLAYCNAVMYADEDDAPYCGCDTCIVREVLDAAWPHMLALAREEVATT